MCVCVFGGGGGDLHGRLMAMALFEFGKSYQQQGRSENSIDCAKISYHIYGSRKNQTKRSNLRIMERRK